MRNYYEKPRDMGRSALPSTARRSARADLRLIKKTNRAQTREKLHEYRYCDEYEDYEDFVTDYPTTEIRYAVMDRRNADKLSVVRWARRLSQTRYKDVRPQDRRGKFKDLLPDTTSGRHILGHVEDAIDPWRRYRQFERYYIKMEYNEATDTWFNPEYYGRAARAEAEREAMRCKLIEIAKTDLQRFNNRLRASCAGCLLLAGCRCRKLRGVHDVDLFLKEAPPQAASAIDEWR